jgi:phage shock protein E
MKKMLSIALCFTILLSAASTLFTGCSMGKGSDTTGAGDLNPSANTAVSAAASVSTSDNPSTEASSDKLTKAEYRKITPQEAKDMMDAGGAIILDVRTQEEFNEGHIKGAVLMPDTDVAQKASSVLPDKNARILVYCRSGRRSGLAAHALVDMGYVEVYDFGGIVDWPYDIVK